MTSRSQVHRREDFRIAIICALPLEYDAVAFAFDEIWDDETQLGKALGDYNSYTIGRIGSHDAVLLLLPNMGKVSATGAAASLRSSYTKINLVILAGICGGVPRVGTDTELLLGDVIISKSIVQYDLGRKYPDRFLLKGAVEESLGRPNKEIRSFVATFQTHHNRSRLQDQAKQILEQIQQKAADAGHSDLYKRPAATEDRLFKPDYVHRHRDFDGCGCSESGACEEALTTSCDILQCDSVNLISRQRLNEQKQDEQEGTTTSTSLFQILVGRIGSSDTVMKSGLDRDQIAKQHDLIALEMEGAGLWDEFPCIIVKSVCDYADSHKNRKWQHFAAATAASTTKALLARYTLTDKKLAPRRLFLVPYIKNPDFVGRFEVLHQLKLLFGHEKSHGQITQSRSRVALYGLGGIGKTQIALAYVFWLQHVYPDISVFWVHASNAERFYQAYSSIAQECGIPGYDDPQADMLALVKAWLEKESRGRWLMVIDNADDLQLFFPSSESNTTNTHQLAQPQSGFGHYLPECHHGSILITTRNKQVGSRLVRGKHVIEVQKMVDSETQQLVHAILDDDISAKDISLLSTRLEYLPLALAQTAAFIHENGISVKEYIQLLDESDDSLIAQLSEPFQAVGRDSATPHALTATWIISFNQIQQQNSLSSEILSMASMLDRQGIPKELITTYCEANHGLAPEAGAATVIKALGTLRAFSFISEAKNNTIDIHRLVQLVTRKWLSNQGRLATFVEHALKTVSAVFPYGQHENRQVCRHYLPHAQAVLRIKVDVPESRDDSRAELLVCMAGYFFYLGQWKDAERSAAESVRLRMDRLGNEHPDTLMSMANLALTFWTQGRWKEAEELEVQVMETRKRVLGEEHPLTLTSIADLASIYRNQGRWKEAEELDIQIMEMRKRVLGEEHPLTLKSIADLASKFWDQGRWKEAEELEIQVIETRKRVLGEEHYDTLQSITKLALIYRNQGRQKEAEGLEVQVIEASKRLLREEHPMVRSIANLASIFWNQGRWTEAEELFIQEMESTKRVLGEEHPLTLTSIANLASTYRKQGRWKEAEELFIHIIETRKRVLGEEHPDTLTNIAHLAFTYKDQGRWMEAEELFIYVMETRKRVLGEEHYYTLTSMVNLALIFFNQGRWKEAEGLEVQVMETSLRVLGEEHPSTLVSIANLASTYSNQGQWKEAGELQAKELHTRLRVLGEEHPDTLTSMANLASTFWNQGRWKEAEALEVQVMETRKRVLGEEHPDTLTSMADLAYTWKDQGRQGDAVLLMEDCARRRQQSLGVEHPDTISSFSALTVWKDQVERTCSEPL